MTKRYPYRDATYFASKYLSYVLHPFLLPVYMMGLLIFGNVIPLRIAHGMGFFTFSLITLNVLIIPAVSIFILKTFGVIDNYSLSTRRERLIPLIVVAVCYGCCGWIFSGLEPLFLLRRFMFAAVGCVLFAFVLNMFWQVSLHMTAMGGAMGIVWMLLYVGCNNLIWPFCVMIVLAGLLASARLYLGYHTPMQVAVGFVGGFFMSSLLIIIS